MASRHLKNELRLVDLDFIQLSVKTDDNLNLNELNHQS